MSRRRARATLVTVTLMTAVAFGLAAPASAVAPASPAVSSGRTADHLSGRDPFPKMSPAKIVAKSAATAKAARTVHVRSVGKQDDGQVLTIDAVLTKTTGQARMSTPKGGTCSIVRYGKDLFLSCDLKFWVAAADGDEEAVAAAPRIAGKWIQLTGDPALTKDLRDIVTLGSWVGDLSTFPATKRVAGRSVRGKATVGLADVAGPDGSVLYVAAKGAPFPLLVATNDRTASITFYDWNKAVKISRPKAAVVMPADLFFEDN